MSTNGTASIGALILALAFVAALSGASPAACQNRDSREGVIDLQEMIERQIAEFEESLRSAPDMPARRQIALLLWLSELYDSTGRSNDVRMSYEKILGIFPFDVGISNRYARYLIDREHDLDAARKLLQDARWYGELTDADETDRGITFLLLGSVHLSRREYEEAVTKLERAVFFCEEAPLEQQEALALLTQALSLSGRYDEAVQTWLELLGKRGRYGEEDLSALANLLNLSGAQAGASPEHSAAEAVEREKEKRKQNIEREGAMLVSIVSRDGCALEGTMYDGEQPGAVLFVPGPGRTRIVFRLFAQMLFSDGIGSLSIDAPGLRDGADTVFAAPAPIDPGRLRDDIAAGIAFLGEKTSLKDNQIVIVSEGQTCEAVEMAVSENRLRCPVLHLSPVFNDSHKVLSSAIPFRPPAPVLMMHSVEDRAAMLSIAFFQSLKTTPAPQVMNYENAGHGAELLKRSPAALVDFHAWIAGALGLKRE